VPPTATPRPTNTALPPTNTPPPNSPTPRPTRSSATATPAGTPEIWATLNALPTATPQVVVIGGGEETPCSWVTTEGLTAQLQCRDEGGNIWVLNVDVRVPCPMNEVIREPYPRILVDQEGYYGLVPAEWSPSEAGEWSAPQNVYSLQGKVDVDGNPLYPDLVRNVRFGLRAQRLSKNTNWLGMVVPAVNWNFAGNSSDGDPRYQEGFTSTFSYAAASYVGPEINTGAVANKGRRFDFANSRPGDAYDLPAFPIKITSYCGFYHSIKLEQSEEYFQPLGSCILAQTNPDGSLIIPAGFARHDCPNGMIVFGEIRYRWTPVVLQSWTPIDMKRFGVSTTYVPYSRATAGGVFRGTVYMEPRGNGIWQPVVEVQTVQENR
jgi:hypothetical protein